MIKSLNTNKIVARVDDIKYCIQYTFLITMKYCIQYTFLITMNLKEYSYKLVQNRKMFSFTYFCSKTIYISSSITLYMHNIVIIITYIYTVL